jgi:cation transport ATPase
METQKLTPGKFALNYGLILGLVMIAIAVVTYVTGMALKLEQWPQWLYYVIFPVTVIYAISQYKKSNGNLLRLGEAIKLGVMIGIISAIVYVLYGIIFNYIIDPEFMDLMKEATRDKMLENPNMTEEMVDQSMAMVEKFMNPLLGSAMWIALSAFFGLIYSLIGGLVMKKEE